MPNMSNVIKKTIIYGFILHSLATPSNSTKADSGRDNKVESNLNLQQSKDNDNSWSFINLHHSATFNRTSIYYGAFTIIMLIIGTLVFLFCCGGMKKFLSHFNSNSNQTQNTPNMLLQQAASMIPMLPIQKQTQFNNPPFNPNQQPAHFGGQTVNYSQIPTTYK